MKEVTDGGLSPRVPATHMVRAGRSTKLLALACPALAAVTI